MTKLGRPNPDEVAFNACAAIPLAPDLPLTPAQIFKRQISPRMTKPELQKFCEFLVHAGDVELIYPKGEKLSLKHYRWKAIK